MRAQPTYEIRIAGHFDETPLTEFADLDLTCRDEMTVITGEFDQATLHGLLEMIRSLGLDLVEARRVARNPVPRGGLSDQAHLRDQGDWLARPGHP
jgi:hypothetical protein